MLYVKEDDVTLIVTGTLAYNVIAAAEALDKRGGDARIVAIPNPSSLKQL